MNKIVKIIKLIFYNKLYLAFLLIKRKRISVIPKTIQIASAKKMKQKVIRYNKEFVDILYISTPDGTNQCVHPDIIKINDGNQIKYIMVLTPYPYAYEILENPVIYESKNLINWSYLSGPIDVPKGYERRHFSDPTIEKMEDLYCCFYRECVYSKDTSITNIYVQTSTNCVEWNRKQLVFSTQMNDYDIISPSICYYNNIIEFYYCAKINNDMLLMSISADNINNLELNDSSLISIKGIPNGKVLWHMSVIPYDDKEIFLLTLADDFGGKNSELYIATRIKVLDEINIVKKVNIKEQIDEIALEYRATGVVDNNNLKIIASVKYKDSMWGCVFVEEENVENLFC